MDCISCKKIKKQNAIVSILGTTSAEAHSAYVLPRLWFLGCLQLHSVFFNYLHEMLSISLHHVALFCASYITTQAHTFATLQKKASFEHNYIKYPYTSGSGKPSKKIVKTIVFTSLDLSLLYTITCCENIKILHCGNRMRSRRGQIVNVHHLDPTGV